MRTRSDARHANQHGIPFRTVDSRKLVRVRLSGSFMRNFPEYPIRTMMPSSHSLTSIPAKKHLGQHFLTDGNMIAKIVGLLKAHPDDVILEIGAGTGALTAPLATTGARILALDVDDRSVEILRLRKKEEGWDRVDIRLADILRTDLATVIPDLPAQGLRILGNLPYYLTSPILGRLLDQGQWIRDAILMMQKEVAMRILSGPGSREYGILSVLSRLHAQPRLAFHVSPGVFVPRPAVWSSVVIFEFYPRPMIPLDAVESFRAVVRAAFNQRRKVLSNALKPLIGARGVPEMYAGKRAEELSVEDYLTLWRALTGV